MNVRLRRLQNVPGLTEACQRLAARADTLGVVRDALAFFLSLPRAFSCRISRIIVAGSAKRAEDAFELIEFIATQFSQVDGLNSE